MGLFSNNNKGNDDKGVSFRPVKKEDKNLDILNSGKDKPSNIRFDSSWKGVKGSENN